MENTVQMLTNVRSLAVAVSTSVRILPVAFCADVRQGRDSTAMESLASLSMAVIETMEAVSMSASGVLKVMFNVAVALDFDWLMTASLVKNWTHARMTTEDANTVATTTTAR